MKKIAILTMITIGAVMMISCSSSKKEVKAPVVVEKPAGFEVVYRPIWFDEQNNPEMLYFFGQAQKHSETLAYDAAVANARLESANYVEVYVMGMIKNYMEEVGVKDPTITALTSKTVKTVANTKFSGTFVSKREIMKKDDIYKAFARLSVPKDILDKRLSGEIKKEEALYNAFKASQSFQELEAATK